MMAKKTDNFDYHTKAEELERIVLALQDPSIEIDEATRLHVEGIKLIGEIEEYLNQAEIVVKKHVADTE
jgi:exodeoxyribonuclease VII small subunit